MLGHRPQSQSLGPYAHHNSSRSFCNSTPNDLNDCFTLLSGLRSSRCSQAPCGMPITPLPSITSGSITPLYIPTDYLTLDFWCASTQRQKSLFRQNTSGEPPPPPDLEARAEIYFTARPSRMPMVFIYYNCTKRQ